MRPMVQVMKCCIIGHGVRKTEAKRELWEPDPGAS